MQEIFKNVVEAAEAAAVCGEAVKRFCREQRELDEVIRSRIRRSREECGRELAYHKAIIENPTATVTQRRIAALEVERLEKQTFTATAEEILEFRRATELALTAILDYEKTKGRFREAHKAALNALGELKEQGAPSRELNGQARDGVDRCSDIFEKYTVSGNFT